MSKCATCLGDGFNDTATRDCPDCNGTGKALDHIEDALGMMPDHIGAATELVHDMPSDELAAIPSAFETRVALDRLEHYSTPHGNGHADTIRARIAYLEAEIKRMRKSLLVAAKANTHPVFVVKSSAEAAIAQSKEALE